MVMATLMEYRSHAPYEIVARASVDVPANNLVAFEYISLMPSIEQRAAVTNANPATGISFNEAIVQKTTDGVTGEADADSGGMRDLALSGRVPWMHEEPTVPEPIRFAVHLDSQARHHDPGIAREIKPAHSCRPAHVATHGPHIRASHERDREDTDYGALSAEVFDRLAHWSRGARGFLLDNEGVRPEPDEGIRLPWPVETRTARLVDHIRRTFE